MIKINTEKYAWEVRQLLICGSILFLSALLWDFLFATYNDLIVHFVFSKFKANHLTWYLILLYFGLLTTVGFYAVSKLWKNQYKLSWISVMVITAFSLIYWWKRIDGKTYNYALLIDLPERRVSIAILDPLFAIYVVISIIFLINLIFNKPYKQNTSFITQDNPISKISDDTLRRTDFFKTLIDELKLVSFDTSRGFAFGISSSWGFGKTSFLEIVKDEFKTEKDVVFIEYNPWLSPGKLSLTQDFFQMFENELSYYIETGNLISTYGEKVSKIDEDKNPLKKVKDLLAGEKSLKERFDEISEVIKRTNRRFFVTIDDLDRLDNAEVLEVLRLIRNTGNFPRVNFIVAYDKRYLENALVKHNIFKPIQYLEKIFDLEILLPTIESIRIKEELKLSIEKALSTMVFLPADLQAVKDQLSTLIFNQQQLTSPKISNVNRVIPYIFTSQRDIIKFTNSLILTFKITQKHTYFPDLFILELIKLKAGAIYEKIISNKNFLTEMNLPNNTGKVYQLSVDAGPPNIAESQLGPIFDIRVVNALTEFERLLLESLFDQPAVNDFKAAFTIVNVKNFESYFIHALPTGVTFAEVSNLIH